MYATGLYCFACGADSPYTAANSHLMEKPYHLMPLSYSSSTLLDIPRLLDEICSLASNSLDVPVPHRRKQEVYICNGFSDFLE